MISKAFQGAKVSKEQSVYQPNKVSIFEARRQKERKYVVQMYILNDYLFKNEFAQLN